MNKFSRRELLQTASCGFGYLAFSGLAQANLVDRPAPLQAAIGLAKMPEPPPDYLRSGPAQSALLSYDLSSFCEKLEQLPGTAFMPGSGGGRTAPLLVIADRR